jgi:hypothetical protein
MALSLVTIGYRLVYCDTGLEHLGKFCELNRSPLVSVLSYPGPDCCSASNLRLVSSLMK